MKIKVYTRNVPIKYVEFDGSSYWYSRVGAVLEELSSSDIMDTVVINDRSLQNSLEVLKIICTNSRGSSYKGRNFAKFYEIFEKIDGDGDYFFTKPGGIIK